jgi:hypothetical protein
VQVSDLEIPGYYLKMNIFDSDHGVDFSEVEILPCVGASEKLCNERLARLKEWKDELSASNHWANASFEVKERIVYRNIPPGKLVYGRGGRTATEFPSGPSISVRWDIAITFDGLPDLQFKSVKELYVTQWLYAEEHMKWGISPEPSTLLLPLIDCADHLISIGEEGPKSLLKK